MKRSRAQLPPMRPGERAFVAVCAVVGLAIVGFYVWLIATGRAPWWLVLLA